MLVAKPCCNNKADTQERQDAQQQMLQQLMLQQ